MITDSLGVPRFTEKDLVDMIHKGHVDKCTQVLREESTEIEKFNQSADLFSNPHLKKYTPPLVAQDEFDSIMQSEWFMPSEYQEINVYDTLVTRCKDQQEVDRVTEELDEYEKRDMINVLRYIIFLVDFMRENNIVWGVGRGSSVASFVLYLIGIHRVNSIQYGLDFREFMR